MRAPASQTWPPADALIEWGIHVIGSAIVAGYCSFGRNNGRNP
jgi:hypothetical protein